MCLEVVFDEEKTQSILEVMPDYVGVWKVALMDIARQIYVAPYLNTVYVSGTMECPMPAPQNILTVPSDKNYQLFFHFWVNKQFVLEQLNGWLAEYAKKMTDVFSAYQASRPQDLSPAHYRLYEIIWRRDYLAEELFTKMRPPRVISCVVHKDWITTIGKQNGGLAVVCKKAVFPKYPDAEVQDVLAVNNQAIMADQPDEEVEETENFQALNLIVQRIKPSPMEQYVSMQQTE